MVASSTESEVKLDAGVGFVLPDLDGAVDGVEAVRLPEQRLTARYVDTADLRLLRSGVSLRHRHERDANGEQLDEWTLKLPLAPSGPVVVRRELRWPGGAEEVPAAADSLVRAWRRSCPLELVTRLVTVRQRTVLRGSGGEHLAEIDDDVVSVMEGSRLAARFRQIEVEVHPGASKRLIRVVLERLEAAGARRGDDRPKVARALGAPAAAPPDVSPVALGGRATVSEVVAATVADGLVRLVRHDAGVRLGDDAEEVHQARVATRRLRSDLRFLRRLLDGGWVRTTRDDLGWLAGLLGAVRDADVLTERLRDAGSGLPADDDRAVAELLAVLAAQRTIARTALVEGLDSDRYTALLDRLAAAVAAPPLATTGSSSDPLAGEAAGAADPGSRDRAEAGDGGEREDGAEGGDAAWEDGGEAGDGEWDDGAEAGGVGGLEAGSQAGDRGDGGGDGGLAPAAGGGAAAHAPAAIGSVRARSVLPGLVARPWRHLAAAVDGLGDRPGDSELHQVRIAAKRLRYACETAAPVCGSPARALGRASADLQTELGDLNDAVVAGEWLRRAALDASPAVALAAGQLLARQHADAASARAAWPREWRRLRRKKLREWLGA